MAKGVFFFFQELTLYQYQTQNAYNFEKSNSFVQVTITHRCHRRFSPRCCSFSFSKKSQKFTSLSRTSLLFSSRCPFSCHSPLCVAPVLPGCLFCFLLSLLSPSSQPQSDRVSPNPCPKAHHEANIFASAEWSERLTPGRSDWLGAAVVGLIPAVAVSFSEK